MLREAQKTLCWVSYVEFTRYTCLGRRSPFVSVESFDASRRACRDGGRTIRFEPQRTANGQTTTFVMDINTGLTQALSDGGNTYLYGNGRISQQAGSNAEYFLGDALGSVRQMVDAAGTLTYTQSYDPFGVITQTGGTLTTSYGFTGEWSDPAGLVYLRARYYALGDGRFISRDTWVGEYNRPLSLNRWLYVIGNPVNFVDPLGLWKILPGYKLSNGGLYKQGMVTMSGSPKRCRETCWTAAFTKMSVFVPTMKGGILYDDIAYRVPKVTNGSLITEWDEYDPIGASFRCMDNAIIVPVLYDKWQTIFTQKGKSNSFSKGGFTNFTVGMNLGMGSDEGFAPYDVNFQDSIDEDWSIALAYWRAQSSLEREQLDLVKLWNEAGASRSTIQGWIGAVAFTAQGWSGVQTYTSREVTIIVQEHKGVPGLFRATIETFSLWRSIRNGGVYARSAFVSFSSSQWQEHVFSLKKVR